MYVGSLPGKIYRTSEPVEVEKDYLSIQVEPSIIKTVAPGKSLDYAITITDFENKAVENADIKIEDGVNNDIKNLESNAQGHAIFNLSVPASVMSSLV